MSPRVAAASEGRRPLAGLMGGEGDEDRGDCAGGETTGDKGRAFSEALVLGASSVGRLSDVGDDPEPSALRGAALLGVAAADVCSAAC